MNSMPIRLVLFDLDDTLCDHRGSFRLRVEAALAALPDEVLSLERDVIVALALAQPSHTWEGVQRALEMAGCTDPAWLERASAVYARDRFLGLSLFPDSVTAVRAIQRRALTGLVTNGPSAIQRAKLARLGIERLFPIVVVSEEVGVAKPDPAIFQYALRLAGVRPEEALYVGDHPVNDVAGAQRAGLTSVWCNRYGQAWQGDVEPHFGVASLWELYRELEEWASSGRALFPGGILGEKRGAARSRGGDDDRSDG